MDRISPIVPTLKAELAGLERELQQDPRARRAAAIRNLLALYELPGVVVPGSDLAAGETTPEGGEPREDSAKQEVLSLLRQRGTSHRKNILKHLMVKGLMGDAENSMKVLSKRLSRWKEVTSDGEGNWSLVQRQTPGLVKE